METVSWYFACYFVGTWCAHVTVLAHVKLHWWQLVHFCHSTSCYQVVCIVLHVSSPSFRHTLHYPGNMCCSVSKEAHDTCLNTSFVFLTYTMPSEISLNGTVAAIVISNQGCEVEAKPFDSGSSTVSTSSSRSSLCN